MKSDIMIRAQNKVQEIKNSISREMPQEEQDYFEAYFAYQEFFDDNFPSAEVPQMSEKEMTETMLRCIEEGKPFDPEIPDDCIA